MVKVIQVTPDMRRHMSDGELSGWPSGVRYEPPGEDPCYEEEEEEEEVVCTRVPLARVTIGRVVPNTATRRS